MTALFFVSKIFFLLPTHSRFPFFKKTISIEPNFEKGWTEIIDFYFKKSDYSNALFYSKKAIDSNGDSPFFSFKAGQLLMKNCNFSDAIFYFENSINLGNVEIDVWNDLLDCLIKLYRFNHAKNIVCLLYTSPSPRDRG